MSFILLTVITGIFYPLTVTAVAQVFFKSQANGSLIYQNGKPAGSSLIGQAFAAPKYLWGRPSATSPTAFNAASSSGSNFGPMNPDYLKTVQARVKYLREAGPDNKAAVPVDLVTASGSGLDPHISLAAAYYQVPRIAKARGIQEVIVKQAIRRNTQRRLLGLMGEPVVNVLKVNLELDENQG
jgi:K+-transporting ATPase ATPase C chain